MNDLEISKNMSRSPSNNNSLTIQQYDLFQNGYKQPDYDRRISFDKVLVIGLGQLGLPVAKYVKDRGFDVYGYDISTKALERAEKTAGIKKAVNFSGFDVYIICVSTHKQEDMFSPQIDGILSIVQDKISKEAKNGALVAIESTIPKGTSKKVFEMLNHRLHVAHAPHRWYALEEKEHGVNQLRVVGGVCDCCLRVAMQFYDGSEKSSFSLSPQSSSLNELESQSDIATAPQSVRTPGSTDDGLKMTVTATALTASGERDDSKKDLKYSQHGTTLSRDMQSSPRSPSSVTTATIGSKAHSASKVIDNTKKTRLGIPMHPVPDIEIAELTKIIENAHRYLQIAFAEDLYLYCQANNINFAELRDSLNTKWNVNVLEPREGIGGHCLPKDTKMFLNSSKSIKSKILEAAIEVDNEYRRLLASSTSHQTVGESLSSRYPDVSKSGDRDTDETILEMTSIGNLVPARAYSSNPINK